MKKLVEKELEENEVFRTPDREKLEAELPYLVGLRKGRLVFRFRRLLVSLEDMYDLNIVDGKPDGFKLRFDGEKSIIEFDVKKDSNKIIIYGVYKGPRGWIVKSKLGDLAKALLEASITKQKPAITISPGQENLEISTALSSLSSLTRLVAKSMLVGTEHIVARGDVLQQVKNILAQKGLFQKYKTIYVSGTGMGVFRLLFENGELIGIYVNVKGKEYVGDEKALSHLEGLFTIKIYTLLEPLREVLAK